VKNLAILFFFLIFQNSVGAQIYFSEILEGYVLFGPENVSNVSIESANFYLKDLEEASEQLSAFIGENNTQISKLREGKVGKKIKREIAAIEKDIEKVNLELEVYLEYLAHWEKTKKQLNVNESLLGFIQGKPDQCLEITSDEGPIPTNELKVEMAPISESPVEFIRMQTTQRGQTWVKKKADRNCLSADPNDCLVWCKVDLPPGFKMIDGNNLEKTFETCPDGFELEDQNLTCQRLNSMVQNQRKSKIIYSSASYTELNILDWHQIDCQ